MSSTQAALILSRGSRRALWGLRFSRSTHSVSTRRESRSSKLSAPSRGSLCCSLQARAKASSRRALSFSMVGSVSMGVLPLGGSVVVVLAADVLVAKRWVGGRGRCFRQGGAVQAVPEDRLDASVGAGANGEGPGAGALQALWAVAAGEPENAEAGAIAHLWMGPLGEDGLDERGGTVSDALPPADEARGGPGQMLLVGLGHVLGDGGVVAARVAPAVGGDADPPVEELHRGRGHTGLHLLAEEGVRDRVEVMVELDVVVDVHPCELPL